MIVAALQGHELPSALPSVKAIYWLLYLLRASCVYVVAVCVSSGVQFLFALFIFGSGCTIGLINCNIESTGR